MCSNQHCLPDVAFEFVENFKLDFLIVGTWRLLGHFVLVDSIELKLNWQACHYFHLHLGIWHTLGCAIIAVLIVNVHEHGHMELDADAVFVFSLGVFDELPNASSYAIVRVFALSGSGVLALFGHFVLDASELCFAIVSHLEVLYLYLYIRRAEAHTIKRMS